MVGRWAAMVALVTLAACANMTPAGRNARAHDDDMAPPRVESVPAAPPVVQPAPSPALQIPAPAVAPMPTPSPSVTRAAPVTAAPPAPAPVVTTPPVAANVAAPAADRPLPRNHDDDVVVMPGGVQRQITPPNGDPRTESERMQDINAWDRCVTHVQSAYESDPMRPQLQSPEEYCSQSLGMANRAALPISRQSRRPR